MHKTIVALSINAELKDHTEKFVMIHSFCTNLIVIQIQILIYIIACINNIGKII